MIKEKDLDYDKVVKALKEKVPSVAPFLSDTKNVEDIVVALRRHSFFVSGLEKINAVKYVQRSLERAIEEGESFRTWKGRIRDTRGQAGSDIERFKRFSDARLETIFRTNLSQASEDGAVEAAKEMGDYLKFSAVRDARTRPSHAALHGIVLKATDPFWDDKRCPLDYNCRCALIPIASNRARRTPAKVLRKKIAAYNEKGGTNKSFAKNTTQDVIYIRNYLKKRAKSSGIEAEKIKDLESRKEKEIVRYAKKVVDGL